MIQQFGGIFGISPSKDMARELQFSRPQVDGEAIVSSPRRPAVFERASHFAAELSRCFHPVLGDWPGLIVSRLSAGAELTNRPEAWQTPLKTRMDGAAERHHEAPLNGLSVIRLPVLGVVGGLRPMMTTMMKPGA